VLCAERAVGEEPFVVFLVDDFLIREGAGVTADLAHAYYNSGKPQISMMSVEGPDISKYGVVRPGPVLGQVAETFEKPPLRDAASDLASIGRYLLTPRVFEVCAAKAWGIAAKFSCQMGSTLLFGVISVSPNDYFVRSLNKIAHKYLPLLQIALLKSAFQSIGLQYPWWVGSHWQ
jgi:NDP-sugar pyrophosphorylase family protein